MTIEDITKDIDSQIHYCYSQSRGWADVGKDYHMAEKYYRFAKWLEIRRARSLKWIFGL